MWAAGQHDKIVTVLFCSIWITRALSILKTISKRFNRRTGSKVGRGQSGIQKTRASKLKPKFFFLDDNTQHPKFDNTP
jgi:hypothetical protein